jgi:hypothetical protein
MKTIVKYAAAAALTGALALAAVTPGQARNGRNAAIIGGFAAGAVVGAAAASAANDGYYYGPGPGYAYEPGYVDDGAYAYEPAPAYELAPTYGYRTYRYRGESCAVDMGYGRRDYTGC